MTYDSVTSKASDPWRLRTQIVGGRNELRSVAEAGVPVQAEIAKNRKPEPQVSLQAEFENSRKPEPQVSLRAECGNCRKPEAQVSLRAECGNCRKPEAQAERGGDCVQKGGVESLKNARNGRCFSKSPGVWRDPDAPLGLRLGLPGTSTHDPQGNSRIGLPWERSSGQSAENHTQQQRARGSIEVVGRLGLADVRAFGLTWEDCEGLLQRLGFKAHGEITAA